jgi:hypothetical protein
MKKIFFTLFLLSSISLFSQQRTGISYQALILNPNGEQLPGYNNQNAPLVNTDICIEFLILDENSSIEYSETQSVKTDKYGMVNLSIGNGDFAGGYSGGWSGIVWSEKSKKLKVNLDTTGSCSSFTEISNQDLTSVPFALFAPGQEGLDGESAYEVWLSEGNAGSVQDYLDSLKGEKGDDGLSAFQIWKDLGNSETEEDFITALKGEDGADGKSAYQIWLDAGNTGTEEEFLNSLKGDSGGDGESASQSLINTTIEVAGQNCTNGGIKIETGIDTNNDGVLGADEVNSSQTKYLCNGSDGTDGTNGTDGTDGTDGSSGGSNMIGEDRPDNIIMIGVEKTNLPISYTIPSGYVGSVSKGLRLENWSYALANSESIQGVIKINGNLYDISEKIMYQNPSQLIPSSYKGFNGDFYVPPGTVISLPDQPTEAYSHNSMYIIKIYKESSISFTSKIITSDTSVPSGKIWRVSSVLIDNTWDSFNNNNEYVYNLKINELYTLLKSRGGSGRTILSYVSDDLWLPAGTNLGNITGKAALSILEYSTGGFPSTTTTTTPPSDLEVGDFYGGGIVFDIAIPGDSNYVEGEIHGFVAPLNWRGINSGCATSYRWNQYPGPLKDMYNSFTQSMFTVGGGETLTNKIANTYLTIDSTYSQENYPNYYGNPWVIAYFSKLNGFDDWFVPNNFEMNRLASYLGIASGNGSSKASNVLASNFVNGIYMDSGYWRSAPQNYAVSPGQRAWNSGAGSCNESSFYIIRSF